MGCGTSFVKYVLFFFNLLVALFGLAVVGVGVAVLLNWTVVTEELQKNGHFSVAPWLFIIVGAIMFIIAFFGCCGAIRESHCMVVTYAIFLLVIIIVQVVIGVLMFVYQDSIKSAIGKTIDDIYDRRSSPANAEARASENVFSELQQQFECCGKHGPTDYLNPVLPTSCCRPGGGIIGNCLIGTAYTDGCTDKIQRLYEKYNKVIAGFSIGIACVEVVGALFALCLANSIRNMDRRSRY